MISKFTQKKAVEYKTCTQCGFVILSTMVYAYNKEWCPSCGEGSAKLELPIFKIDYIYLSLKMIQDIRKENAVATLAASIGWENDELETTFERSKELLDYLLPVEKMLDLCTHERPASFLAAIKHMEAEEVRKNITKGLTLLKDIRDTNTLDLCALDFNIEYHHLIEIVVRLDEVINDLAEPVQFI